MYVYQVTLKSGRTDTLRVTADSLLDAKAIYENFSNGVVTSIKKVVYVDNSPDLDASTPYYRELKALISNGTINRFLVVRFAKALLDKDRLIGLIKSNLSLNDKPVTSVENCIVWS